MGGGVRTARRPSRAYPGLTHVYDPDRVLHPMRRLVSAVRRGITGRVPPGVYVNK